MRRLPTPSWLLVCALTAIVASCGPTRRPDVSAPEPARPLTWIIARDATPRQTTPSTAPALMVRPSGTTAQPQLLPLRSTRIAASVVGPFATIERRKTYGIPSDTMDAFVGFTPPAAPTRQDHVVRIDGRTMTILVRDRREADALAKEQSDTSILTPDSQGRVAIPLGVLSGSTSRELVVETMGIVPWREGAYELTIARVPDGEITLAAEVYGPGPIVVLNSPSHSIDCTPASLEHLRVRLRETDALHEQDFVLRYRVDPDDQAGTLVVAPDGAGTIVGLVVHPFERNHEPIAASELSIDWNGAQVSDVRPAHIDALAAGTPLVVLARAQGTVGPVTVHAKVGREARTLRLDPADGVPRAGLVGLPLLWARAPRSPVTTRR